MSRLSLPTAAVALALALGWAAWHSAPDITPVALQPSLTGQTEYCLTCHQGIEEVSAAHPASVFGCVRCHGGEALALDADLAHSTLRGGANPSDLAVVEQNCGGDQCHAGAAADQRDHIARVTTSIQTTYAGAIANICYAFGGQPDLSPRYALSAVVGLDPTGAPLALAELPPATAPMLEKFQANCLTCHLRAPATDAPGYRRLTGCAACHSLTNADGTYSGTDPTINQNEAGHAQLHRLTTAIPYTQCNTCHNRGNYDLRTMTFTPRADQPADRLHDYYQPIAQCTLCEVELDCVDCHTAGEAMGDGALHATEAGVQYVECRTCHGTLTEPPLTTTLTDPNDVALRRAALNPLVPLALGDTIVVTAKGEPLWSVQRRLDGSFQQVSKVDGMAYAVPLVQIHSANKNPMNKPLSIATSAMPSSADAPANATAADLPRRAALQLGLAASGLLAAGGLVRYLGYQAAAAVPTAFELDAPEAYAAGTALHLAEAGAWLLRDAGGLYAIATRCPHLGCTVERQAAGFRCPCHGSEFAPDGQVRRGPATEDLAYLQLTRSAAGRVVVHTDQTAAAAERLT